MEAERRSTMSSLKGQLSNVEGSVKSMKVAVVVGSVLTVACLAAVFGVTVLANEVSKEVKVSNGALATKAGSSVLTATLYGSDKVSAGIQTIHFGTADVKVASKVQAVVADKYVIVDGALITIEAGANAVSMQENSLLSVALENASASRTMNWDVKKVVAAAIGVELSGIGDAVAEFGRDVVRCARDLWNHGVCSPGDYAGVQ